MSEKYDSIAVAALRRSVAAVASWPFCACLCKVGIAMLDRMPMMTETVSDLDQGETAVVAPHARRNLMGLLTDALA